MVISVGGIFITQEALPKGSDVIIEINGKPEYTFPLDIDRKIPIKGNYGDCRVEIKDKKVRIAESDCPKKLCVEEGWISRGVIVCLPNRVIVFVGSSDSDIDAITG